MTHADDADPAIVGAGKGHRTGPHYLLRHDADGWRGRVLVDV